MEPRDLTKEIHQIAQSYHFAQEPGFVRDVKEWLESTLRAIDNFLRELFHQKHSQMDSSSVSTILQVAIWIAAIVGIVFLINSLIKRAKRLSSATNDKVRGAAVVEEIWDASGWQKQAEKLAASRDYKGACRAVYLSLLQSMHEHGVAEFAPARTNYEYSYALAGHPELQKQFKVLAERVEVIWFGNRSAEGQDYKDSLADLSTMTSMIARIQQRRNPAGEAMVAR